MWSLFFSFLNVVFNSMILYGNYTLVFPLERFIDLLRIYERFNPPFFYTPKIGQVMIFSTYLHGFSDFFFWSEKNQRNDTAKTGVSDFRWGRGWQEVRNTKYSQCWGVHCIYMYMYYNSELCQFYLGVKRFEVFSVLHILHY